MTQIINTPTNSGLGDSLQVAMSKVNDNFSELFSLISGATPNTVTHTNQLTNNGADGSNPFITIASVPTSWAISSVTGLSTALATLNTTVSGNTSNVTTILSDINDINSNINTLMGLITAQNLNITNINIAIDGILVTLASYAQPINNSTTTALSLAMLNSVYPSAINGFRVRCMLISTGGKIYEKTSTGWIATSAVTVS